MRSRLFHESLYVVGLLVMVWFVMLFVFHRLHRARLETEASDRAKTRFMANVTHEFRTPLNGILGYTQMFKLDRELMEAHGKGVGTIDQCAEHLLLLINDILDFSKADEASLQLHPEEIDFPDFLKTLIEMAEIRAQNKQLKFVCRFPDELPARLSFDDKRLRQVLLNLLSNAIKFTDSGRVCLELDCPEISYGRARMTFSVTDTGIGIAREDLNRIFVPFQQLDNSVTRAEGSGLGLSISQRLVHLMGSAIQVTSKPGEGSCFRFQLNLPVVSSERVAVTCDRYRASRELSPAWEGDMAVPDSSQIASLSAAAKQHNITAVRNLLSSMKDQQELAAFVEKAEQMMSQYRFKPMADWLDSLCEVRTEEGSNAPQNS